MVELIHLVDDISMPVKLGWVGVIVWAAVQVMWYRRGRVLPEELEAQADDAPAKQAGMLSIAAALDFPVRRTPREDADLGEAAGMALESLLEEEERGPGAHQNETTSTGRVSYQSSLSY